MVKIITDSTSGLSKDFSDRYDIPVIPQIVIFGEESFYEGITIDNIGFLMRLQTSAKLPTTAAPPPELFAQEFARLAPLGEPILCIHPSAEVSGTVRSATVAAKDFPGTDIRVIDTRVVASPLATMVQLAAEWAQSGLDIDTIQSRLVNMIPRCRLYFMVDTLEYLAKGGRIGGASALLGSVLQIKPILTMHNGIIDTYEKARTHNRAYARLISIVLEQIPRREEAYLSVMHASVPEEATCLAEELGRRLSLRDIPILDVPPAITTHGGPGILGVSFFI